MKINPDVIKNLLGKLEETGFIPKSITCDQHGTNRSLYKKLGFTPNKPYIYSPNCPDRKIFGIFDIIHVLKNLVNGLMDRAALLPDGHFVSKEDWEELLPLINTEISPGFRLTQRQLDAKGSARMDVSRAVTIMSHHVSACFKKFFPNDPAKLSISKFIKNTALMLQTLQSRVISHKKDRNKCAFRYVVVFIFFFESFAN